MLQKISDPALNPPSPADFYIFVAKKFYLLENKQFVQIDKTFKCFLSGRGFDGDGTEEN